MSPYGTFVMSPFCRDESLLYEVSPSCIRQVHIVWGESILYGYEIYLQVLKRWILRQLGEIPRRQLREKSCEVFNANNDDLALGFQIDFILSHMLEIYIAFNVWWKTWRPLIIASF